MSETKIGGVGGGGRLCDVRVALLHAGAAPPLREYGLFRSLAVYRQSLIALEYMVGEMSKKSFIGRETETGGVG